MWLLFKLWSHYFFICSKQYIQEKTVLQMFNLFLIFSCQGGGDRHIREAFTTPNDLEIEEIQMDDEVF